MRIDGRGTRLKKHKCAFLGERGMVRGERVHTSPTPLFRRQWRGFVAPVGADFSFWALFVGQTGSDRGRTGSDRVGQGSDGTIAYRHSPLTTHISPLTSHHSHLSSHLFPLTTRLSLLATRHSPPLLLGKVMARLFGPRH